ncbi:MAG: methyltransferase domain-containing protein [Candidatus Marinimicrobia bacterium]|nr:methyltransferase domain-containing protein [Candidatus Neomarinimicrobiota bacterium]
MGADKFFNDKFARKELKRYRRRGPVRATLRLIQAIKDHDIRESSLLDIGGGIGVIQLELLKAGASRSTDIDAASAYLEIARQEATRENLAARTAYQFGDFVELADQVAQADIVTLDKVLCCYDDIDSLVKSSAAKAGQYYAVIYPQDKWWTQIIRAFGFLVSIIYRTTFQTFIHSTDHVDRLIRSSGLKPIHTEKKMFWQMVIYGR